MATIASFTTNGMPTGPQMTLDALMMRQKELAAQAVNRQMPAMRSPWQGAAYLADRWGTALQQRAVDKNIATGNQRTADILTGMGDRDPNSSEIGEIYGWDREMGGKLLADMITARRERANRETFATLTPEEETAAGLDASKSYQRSSLTNKVDQIGGGGVNVVNEAAQMPQGDVEEWNKTGAKGLRERIDTYANEGVTAGQNLQQIDQLEFLMQDMPTGLNAAAQTYLRDNWGVSLGEGASQLQAFNAIVDRLVPSQRPAGSGPMSDKDIILFRGSLPSYLNTPEGNGLILKTMRGIAEYNVALGDIASNAGEMGDPVSARKFFNEEVNKLADPLADWRAAEGKRKGGAEAGAGAGPGDAAAPAEPVIAPKVSADGSLDFSGMTAAQINEWIAEQKAKREAQPVPRQAVPNGG